MEQNIEPNYRRGRGHIWAGLFLVIIGGILLAKTLGVMFPVWFFTWPVLLITIGLFVGLRHNFRGGAWLILMLIGGFFLLDEIFPAFTFRNYIIPFLIMAVGIAFILKPRYRRCGHRFRGNNFRHDWRARFENRAGAATEGQTETGTAARPQDFFANANDFLDITAIFGGVKKKVFSKSLKGGDITTFMGGAEIDLRQADFASPLIIDATNIFGGTKLIIPSTWDIQSEVVAIFGGVDDKRQTDGQSIDPNKVVRLDGTCLFGGIEIRSY